VVKDGKCLFQVWFPSEEEAKIFQVRTRFSEGKDISFQNLNIIASCACHLVYDKFKTGLSESDLLYKDSKALEKLKKNKLKIISMFKEHFCTTISKTGIDDIDFEKDFEYLLN